MPDLDISLPISPDTSRHRELKMWLIVGHGSYRCNMDGSCIMYWSCGSFNESTMGYIGVTLVIHGSYMGHIRVV